MNRQDVGGLGGEEKWRPDRVGTPEAGEIRRGRREGPQGGTGEKWRAIALPTRVQEACWAPR